MSIVTSLRSNVSLEQHKRLSDSLIWKWQQEFFENQGIQAWVNQVPFYITCNPFIAHCYAKIALGFIQDWIAQHKDAKNHPFYIMELGTGSGRFSFYVIKALHELREQYGLHDIAIHYVMTDFTDHNLEFHQSHPALQPYIEKGFLDFALYDMEKEQNIHLIRANKNLDSTLLKNPLTVFANYIFDTISQDIFNVQNGKLSEVNVSLSTDKKNLKDNKPIQFEKIHFTYSKKEIQGAYSTDEHLNALLEMYRKDLRSTHFLIPMGSLRALNWLKKLSNNKVFLISSDKGYSKLSELENLPYPSMVSHGCFSMMVNFHAMREYIEKTGGDFYSQSSRSSIHTSVATLGFSFEKLTRTRVALQDNLDGFSPADYFNLHQHMYGLAEKSEMNALVSYLLLSRWDPHIFLKMSSHISTIAETEEYKSLTFLEENMHKIADNYYYIPKTECVLFEIGVFYHSLKKYSQAISYYLRAEQFVGEQFGVHYNSALCFYHTKNYPEALARLRRALKIEPQSSEAKEWVIFIEKISIAG